MTNICNARDDEDSQNSGSILTKSRSAFKEYCKISLRLISGDFLLVDDSLPVFNSF